MPTDFPQVVIITGLMAAGKSTVAQALAARLQKSVHVRGDLFRRAIVNGRAEIGLEHSPVAQQQLELRYNIACHVCCSYADAGFNVIYQDVILGDHLLKVAARLRRWSAGVVVLAPSIQAIHEREASRAKTGYSGGWTPERLAVELDATPRVGLWVDTSHLTVEQTVQTILDSLRGVMGFN